MFIPIVRQATPFDRVVVFIHGWYIERERIDRVATLRITVVTLLTGLRTQRVREITYPCLTPFTPIHTRGGFIDLEFYPLTIPLHVPCIRRVGIFLIIQGVGVMQVVTLMLENMHLVDRVATAE